MKNIYCAASVNCRMTVFTLVAVAAVCTGGTAAAAGAAVGASFGAAGGATGTAAGVAGAIAGSTSAGAIAGAGAGLTAGAAATGAAAGATAAAAVGSSVVGGTGLATVGLASGPIGWLLVGTTVNLSEQHATYDCWKPVLHDNSVEASSGMLLQDLCIHPNISHVSYTAAGDTDMPDIVVENIWNEKFKIEYLVSPATGKLFGHAKKF